MLLSDPTGAARRPLARADLRTRDLIDQAVAALPSLGVGRSAAFLCAMNIPLPTALRCLCRPAYRRSAGRAD